MMDMVRSVGLKIDRAAAQAQVLCKEVSDWTTTNPIAVEVQLRENRHGYRVIQKEYAIAPPLEQWGLVLGECIHNLRSALDNLAYALARLQQDPPARPGRIAFPIFKDRQQFLSNGKQNIDQLPTVAAGRIEQLQPFQRDDPNDPTTPDQDPLLQLQWLSNTDKHRVPTVALVSITEWSNFATMKFFTDEDADANVPPDVTYWAGPLSPGTVLMEWKTNCPIESVTGGHTAKSAVFFEGVHGAVPLIEHIQGLVQYTATLANQFGEFFAPPQTA
jgi:hypothetical protein